MASEPFLVAGGGIAGLAASLALSASGHAVSLCEQAPDFTEVGAGLQMSPNGVSALRRLGAWDAIEPHCVQPSEIHVRDGTSGNLLQRIRLGKPFEMSFGAPYRVCHRADLLAGLLAVARTRLAVRLQTMCRATHMASTAAGATLALADGTEARGQAVLAADGIRSTLREQIAPGTRPCFRGHILYRGLLDLADVPSAIASDCVTLWLCAGGHVVHYPVSNWRKFNVVAAVESAPPASGWSAPGEAGPLLAHFDRADEALQELLGKPRTWLLWPGADLAELPRWTRERLALIGDAAHASLPYLAQGAVMALEDAATLAEALAAEPDCTRALALYEARRRPRTARIQRESRRLGRLYHARGAMALVRNAGLRLLGPEAALARHRWIYGWRA
jgi:salicylate hydroxylase